MQSILDNLNWKYSYFYISFTECNYRERLMKRMLTLIPILIVYMFYGLCAKWYEESLLLGAHNLFPKEMDKLVERYTQYCHNRLKNFSMNANEWYRKWEKLDKIWERNLCADM
jgi:hypothetical protein